MIYPKRISVLLGRPTVFKCFKNHKVQWIIDRKDVDPGLILQNGRTVFINETTLKHYGTYTCKNWNTEVQYNSVIVKIIGQ